MNCDSKDSDALGAQFEKIDIDFEHYVKRADKAEKEIEDLTKTIKALLVETPETQEVPEELEKLRVENNKLKYQIGILQRATAEIQSKKTQY